MPGMGTPNESTEIEFLLGNIGSWQLLSGVVSSAAVDARNSPTTLLSRGLVLGRVTSTQELKEYDATSTDGSQVAVGILFDNVNMLNPAGSVADKAARFVWFGRVRADQLGGLDYLARRQLAGQIFFDDLSLNSDAYLPRVMVKATDYTVTAADNNVTFSTRGAAGAVAFTLPTLARGLRYRFYNEADQNMTVSSVVADTMVGPGDLDYDSVAFTTAGDLIGACIEVWANDNASKWHIAFLSTNAATLTD
jgi:hypothetical protein